MAEINDIRALDEKPLTNGWSSSREALAEYENIFGQLSRYYSMLEIALNINFGTQEDFGRKCFALTKMDVAMGPPDKNLIRFGSPLGEENNLNLCYNDIVM